MSKMGNQEIRVHSAHEVGALERSEEKDIADQGLAHDGPYEVEELQYI